MRLSLTFPTLCLIALAIGTAPRPLAAQPHAPPQIYHATYAVQYKSRRVGQAEFQVTQDGAAQQYRFSSLTTAVGLLRLVRPRPIVEISEFTLRNGEIRPLRFEFHDGSRSGSDNFTLRFDWAQGTVHAERGGQVTALPLQAGTLDRGTLQVALMRDLRSGHLKPSYRLADEDSLREYDYRLDGTELLTTGAGPFDTQRLVQSRPGSDRLTVFWLAPALDYLPVRVEQRHAGEPRATLLLEQVQGLSSGDAPVAQH